MKKITILASVVVVVFGFAGVASALSGQFMFTMSGNDSNTDPDLIETEINNWFADNGVARSIVDLDFYAKYDWDEQEVTGGTLSLTDLEYDEGEVKKGSWETDLSVEFYSVKTGTGFAFYWIEGGADSADWTTEMLDNKGLSHLSVWNPGDPGTPPAAVPEPSTVLLIGAGLLGIVGLGRKRIKK